MTYNIYGFWDITCNRQILFVILGYFLSFYPLTAQKMKISKKWKHLETSSFYTSVPKLLIISYTVLEILCVTHVIVVFHFGQFFALLHPPPNNNQKKKFSQIKNARRYHHSTQVYQKSWLYAILFLRYGVWLM